MPEFQLKSEPQLPSMESRSIRHGTMERACQFVSQEFIRLFKTGELLPGVEYVLTVRGSKEYRRMTFKTDQYVYDDETNVWEPALPADLQEAQVT